MAILNREQIVLIEKYLDTRKLTQIDLRDEVLDHMANSIENNIEKGKPFEAAFILEKQKWNKELKQYSSLWIGLVWNGPKIMMKQCEKYVKKMYFNIVWKSALSTILLIVLIKISNLENRPNIFIYAFSIFYFLIAGALILSIFQVIKTKKQSTYRYLFKKNAFPTALMLILLNPYTLLNYVLTTNISTEIPWYSSLSFFLMAFLGLEIFNFSRKHIQELKLKQL